MQEKKKRLRKTSIVKVARLEERSETPSRKQRNKLELIVGKHPRIRVHEKAGLPEKDVSLFFFPKVSCTPRYATSARGKRPLTAGFARLFSNAAHVLHDRGLGTFAAHFPTAAVAFFASVKESDTLVALALSRKWTRQTVSAYRRRRHSSNETGRS